jgi:hypothetical protein
MARRLQKALADSKATADFYGFTPAELKEYENIPRIQDKKQQIEVEKKLLEKIGRSIERIEISIGRQYSIVTELNRESDNSNYKLSTIKSKTQKSKNLINANNEKLKESIFIENSKMVDLEYNLKEFKKEKGRVERKITRLMEELETLQKGGKKRVVKRKTRSVRPIIRRKPTVARRWM